MTQHVTSRSSRRASRGRRTVLSLVVALWLAALALPVATVSAGPGAGRVPHFVKAKPILDNPSVP
jgi:hypothetical protein